MIQIKNYKYILALIISLIAGAIFFAFYNEWLIIKIPAKLEYHKNLLNINSQKKTIKLFWWKNEKWNNEDVDIISSESNLQTLSNLINVWLSTTEEEGANQKKVTIESMMIGTNNNSFVSFNRNPFEKQSSIHQKIMWIEGILKTIRENGIRIQSIQFLVHHKPIQDYHVDFSKPWHI